jgi:hypothetical protein
MILTSDYFGLVVMLIIQEFVEQLKNVNQGPDFRTIFFSINLFYRYQLFQQ